MDTPIATPAPVFALQRAYVKGISLEMPKGSDTFAGDTQANINVNLDVALKKANESIFEVTVRGTLTMTSTVDNSAVLVLEIEQAGLFELRNIPEAHIPELLEIGCPHTLTPYLRAALTDMLTRASLPPFYLPEINWAHIRQQRLQAELAEKNKGGAPLKLVH